MVCSAPSSEDSDFFRLCPSQSIPESFLAQVLIAYYTNTREIKLDVTWSYVKRQTAKMKLLPSVFSSFNSRVKIFLFVANSRRHFSISM